MPGFGRPALDQALAAARLHRCSLVVVSKVDRLTRSVAFLSRLLEAGVDVRFADLPQIEGATGKFMLQQMVSVAELEAAMISTRTKAALKAARKRGTKLGGDRGSKPSAKARAKAEAVPSKRAANRATDIAPNHSTAGERRDVSAGHCCSTHRSRHRDAARWNDLARGAGAACPGAALTSQPPRARPRSPKDARGTQASRPTFHRRVAHYLA